MTNLVMAVALLVTPSGSIVDELLTQKMKFSATDLRELEAGSAVIQSLETPRSLPTSGLCASTLPPGSLSSGSVISRDSRVEPASSRSVALDGSQRHRKNVAIRPERCYR